jgi:ubiquinone/menaquinone biosynthesis C-methylase UbiE
MLTLCSVDYRAPCDAAKINLPDRSIDYYTSFHVFEHIPPEVLANILAQGNRIVKDGGLFVHCIDYRDHFAFDDKTISKVNFLRYSDREWSKYMSRYSYTNRLRHDDFLSLLSKAGHEPVSVEPVEDEQAEGIRNLIETGSLPVDIRFRPKAKEILAITGAWIVAKKVVT